MPTYYPIDETAARRAKEMSSFYDYKPGSATASYRQEVDKAAAIAEAQKTRVDPMYHEKIDRLLDTYARKLAENLNHGYAIAARCPSVLIAGPANFPVRKKEKQNRADDANIREWQEIQGILHRIRGVGTAGISSDDENALQKLREKLARHEREQEAMKSINAYYRKHGTLDGRPLLSAEETEKIKAAMARDWRANPKPYEACFYRIPEKTNPPDSNAHAVLDLPASPYELLDALDRLRLEGKDAMLWEITEYPQFEELKPRIDKSGSFYELNALAQRLSELDEPRSAVFAGLVKMENPKSPIPLPRLIDLAHGVERSHVCYDALNDSQLGRIRAESGRVPGLDKLPKEAFEILDFEQIGRRARVSEKGVFVERTMDHPGGYVALDSPLTEPAEAVDLTPKTPDHTMLLKVSDGYGSVRLKLPAGEQELAAVPQALDEPDWLDLSWTCLDCKVPSLADAVSEVRDIHAVNDFAEMLSGINDTALVAYKALLEASNCQDILRARLLALHLSDYTFSPQFASPAELAKEELSVLLCKTSAETILPYVDLQKYGEALIKQCGGELTGYGLIERIDGHLIQSPRQEGGMTLG